MKIHNKTNKTINSVHNVLVSLINYLNAKVFILLNIYLWYLAGYIACGGTITGMRGLLRKGPSWVYKVRQGIIDLCLHYVYRII